MVLKVCRVPSAFTELHWSEVSKSSHSSHDTFIGFHGGWNDELLLDVDCEVVKEPLGVEPVVSESEFESESSESRSESDESESDVSSSVSESVSVGSAELEAAAPEEVCDGSELVAAADTDARLFKSGVELCGLATGVAEIKSSRKRATKRIAETFMVMIKCLQSNNAEVKEWMKP